MSDIAFNEKTKEWVTAMSLWLDNSSYQFPHEEVWYADPNDIESYDKTKVQDITKIITKFREGCDEAVRKDTGTVYHIAPCFFIPNKTELGINTIPESKEHKLAKNWIYNRIKNKNLKFKYSTVKRPFDYDNLFDIKDLDINYNQVGIEVQVKNNKTQRADIILPFNKPHYFLGTGIVIEIQFSKQLNKTTEKRNYEWAFKGYSICWIWDTNFENLSENIIELKEDILYLEPHDKILAKWREDNEKGFREIVQDLSRQIDSKMKELNYPFCIGECNQCKQGFMTKKRAKIGGDDWYGCSNWKNGCKHSISIPKGYDSN